MNKSDTESFAKLHEMLGESDKHFSYASQIWNSFGVDNPLLTQEAAQSALQEYQKSADLLDLKTISALPNSVKNRVLANKEQALAQISSMKLYLAPTKDITSLNEKLESCGEAIDHLQKALEFLALSSPSEEALEFRLKNDLLHIEGINATISARLALREDNLTDASRAYALSEKKFLDLMKAYESRSPELSSIQLRVEKHFEIGWDTTGTQETDWVTRDSQDNNGIRTKTYILRTDAFAPLLSWEDLYRRAMSNYYARRSSRCGLEAYEIMGKGGSPKDAEKKLTDSVRFISFAMEAFPANLEFHSDLFNIWRTKGQVFGCPFIETDKYLHTRCPILIKKFIGKWYVSPTLEYDSLVCTVCGKDILECSHQPGQKVDDTTVQYQRQNLRIESVSLVDIPEDPRCRIEWISIPKEYFPVKPNQNDQWRCYICQREATDPPTIEDVF